MSESVIIVGCGVMGLSSALEFAKNGFKVTALDAYPVPSPWSAANDYNKIIRAEYDDEVYTKMSIEALHLWRDEPMFKGIYHECGRILITPESHQGRKDFEKISIDNLQKYGEGQKIEYYKGGSVLAKKFHHLEFNSVAEDTEFKWNPESGLAHAANALRAVHGAAEKLGVKFIFGEAGRAVGVKKIKGVDHVVCADGSQYTADKIVISAGASTGGIVDLKQQQAATGLFVTHIKLTPEEFKKYRDIPIVFDSLMGYFFPPDPDTLCLKIALPGSGASNYVQDPFNNGDTKSLPRYKLQHPEDTIPTEGCVQAKQILGRYVPELAYHQLIDNKACWIADTSDSHFIIDKVPTSDKVFVVSGDSGHAFKFLPNIGKYVVQKLRGTLNEELSQIWRWREDAEAFDATSCSWRVVSSALDFSEVDWVEETVSSDRIAKL